MKRITILSVLLLLAAAWLPAQIQKPEDLKFQPLSFKPPRPEQFRMQLGNGLRAYMMEDRALPMISITAFVNFGSLYDSKEKAGLSALLGGTLIKGGTKKMEGPAIEEKIDFLGASLNFMPGERVSTLTLNVLSKDLDAGLALFCDVLTGAEFRDEPVNLARSRTIERLRMANDSPDQILAREYQKLLYGDHPLTYQPFKKTLESVTPKDLKVEFSRYFTPGNVILAAAGDFKKEQLKDKLNKLLRTWKTVSVRIPEFSRKFPQPEPGVYFVQKAINQGYINMGHLGVEESDPDYFAVQVMNFILGGGSFTSRITTKVRSDEGLAYNTGSRFTVRWGFPGVFAGYVQTKSETVGYAIELIRREFERVRSEQVSAAEMDTAKNYYLESFASFFATPQAIVSLFARNEMEGKPRDYYQSYQEKFAKVTAADVQRVAQKFIHPDKMAILVVGDWEKCNVGSAKFPDKPEKFGKVHQLFLTDYLTGNEIK